MSDAARAPGDPAAPVDELVAAINGVGTELLEVAVAAGGETIAVVSPTSVAHAVLILREAGDPASVDAIDGLFGFPEGTPAHDAWNVVDLAIADSNGADPTGPASGEPTPTVTIAGRLWPRVGFEPDPVWLDLLASRHGAEVEPIDVNRPEDARDRVNEWISDETDGIIPQLLPPGFIDRDTTMVLTDAVYFKAEWERPFIKYGPQTATFTTLGGAAVEAEFLVELELDAPRGEGDGWVAAELPYAGGDWSMLVVVPDAGEFETFRSGFGTARLAEIDANLTTGPYELRVPTWAGNAAVDLLPWLQANGIAPGDYPGAGGFLGEAVHAADIDVDEYGTIAAASTALGVETSGPPEPDFFIIADRPFLYLIRDIGTGLILFQGQVIDPTLR